MRTYYDEFQKIKKYKYLGTIVIIIGVLIAASLLNLGVPYWIPVITFVAFSIVGVLLERKYRCPCCGRVLDSRIPLSELRHCSYCGAKIHYE